MHMLFGKCLGSMVNAKSEVLLQNSIPGLKKKTAPLKILQNPLSKNVALLAKSIQNLLNFKPCICQYSVHFCKVNHRNIYNICGM